MLATYQVSDAVTAAVVIAEKLPPGLSKTAVRLYTALCGAAIETAQKKGYSSNVTHVVMHLPLEVLASVCGIHRVTAWRNLPALRELGVLDYRPLKGTLRGATVNTGTLFQVRLNPSSGSKCRLSFADLKHKWRDLDRDVRRKRTAYHTLKTHVQQSLKTSTKGLDISRLTMWTLNLESNSTPLDATDRCKAQRPSLESLLDVRFSRKDEKNKAVDNAAQALAQALADSRSIDFYRKLVWGALRRSEAGTDYFQVIFVQATRAAVDLRESFARKAGAIFCARLKQAGILEELMQT